MLFEGNLIIFWSSGVEYVCGQITAGADMPLLTLITRVHDSLPLVGVMVDVDPKSGRSLHKFQKQASTMLRNLTAEWPARLSIATGPYLFHYKLKDNICYLVLCEKNLTRRLAFNYLDLLAQEFTLYFNCRAVDVTVPYGLSEFEVYIRRLERKDSIRRRSTRNVIPSSVEEVRVVAIRDLLKDCAVPAERLDEDVALLSRSLNRDAILLSLRWILLIGIGLGLTLSIIIICAHICED